ncbi:MAG: hypothetical protein IPN68_12395 [Bacteroidetes bacterium]|nr:hypothetical protein [Bacteroidota bacterium]
MKKTARLKSSNIKSIRYIYLILLSIVLISSVNISRLSAQTEVMAWSNITGIRVDGQLMEFESSLRVISANWLNINSTGREKQRPKYDREGNKQTVITKIGAINFTQLVEDIDKGITKVTINVSSEADTIIDVVYFSIYLPDIIYAGGTMNFKNCTSTGKSGLQLSSIKAGDNIKASSKGVIIEAGKMKLDIGFDISNVLYIRREKEEGGIQLYTKLMGSKIKKGASTRRVFTIKTSGEIDHSEVEIALDSRNPGRKFDGLGGNFRLQNPTTDPQVIDYCLDNMRVAWGRVEMPWGFWHPDENTDPIAAAESGKINPRVDAAMLMAQRLAKKGMPVIISDWSAPAWAILGDPREAFRNRSRGIYGYQLNPDKTEKIYKSIGDYIQYMKDNYGVETSMFSFNESDLGINVRHTGKEHAEFIKGLGDHLAKRGLATKLLLGDNSDATTYDFILPSMNDPETHKYIGAVSFHSWRGCTDETLKKWAGAAKELNVPLLVGEGSTDAAAWNYPEIFSEESFAFYEINLYTRILSICEPLSILQWQLTADYSVMTGAGIFGTQGPLVPTQRFWNLKQLASTPSESFAIPVKCSKDGINCAAFGNIARGEYALHIVNNGAERKAVITGIPQGITNFDIFVTDKTKGMEKVGEAKVSEGKIAFTLEKAGFITLISKK